MWTISRARMMAKVKGQIVDGVIHVFGEKVGFGNGQGQKDKEGGSKGVQMIVRRTMSERGGTGWLARVGWAHVRKSKARVVQASMVVHVSWGAKLLLHASLVSAPFSVHVNSTPTCLLSNSLLLRGPAFSMLQRGRASSFLCARFGWKGAGRGQEF